MNSADPSPRYWASIIGWVFQFFTLLLAIVIGYLGDVTSFFVVVIPSGALLAMYDLLYCSILHSSIIHIVSSIVQVLLEI